MLGFINMTSSCKTRILSTLVYSLSYQNQAKLKSLQLRTVQHVVLFLGCPNPQDVWLKARKFGYVITLILLAQPNIDCEQSLIFLCKVTARET